MAENTKPCHDCGTELTVPFTYCVPATMAEIQAETKAGMLLVRDSAPLCKPCWERAPKPTPASTPT